MTSSPIWEAGFAAVRAEWILSFLCSDKTLLPPIVQERAARNFRAVLFLRVRVLQLAFQSGSPMSAAPFAVQPTSSLAPALAQLDLDVFHRHPAGFDRPPTLCALVAHWVGIARQVGRGRSWVPARRVSRSCRMPPNGAVIGVQADSRPVLIGAVAVHFHRVTAPVALRPLQPLGYPKTKVWHQLRGK